MKQSLIILVAGLALAACQQQPAGEAVTRIDISGSDEGSSAAVAQDGQAGAPNAQSAQNSACTMTDFEGIPLTHCVADPATHRIATAHSSPDGERYGSLAALAEQEEAGEIAFAINGGMFAPDGLPVGYYVEESNRLAELNREDGNGNFYLKPNGVFFGTGGAWEIKTADAFYTTVVIRPEFGTQSGPMLVINGELHPSIQENGPSKAIRNGVGVDAEGKAHFVISETPLSFGQLARFFRDELQTPNALFLDGNVSSLWDPAQGRVDNRATLGPMLVVENYEAPAS